MVGCPSLGEPYSFCHSAYHWRNISYQALAVTLTSGISLGPYQILSLLGAGGKGEVCLTQDRRLGRRAALKLKGTLQPGSLFLANDKLSWR